MLLVRERDSWNQRRKRLTRLRNGVADVGVVVGALRRLRGRAFPTLAKLWVVRLRLDEDEARLALDVTRECDIPIGCVRADGVLEPPAGELLPVALGHHNWPERLQPRFL